MKKLMVTIAALCLTIASAEAHGRHHYRHHHRHHARHHHGGLINYINYKLARYVHPTGFCGVGSEERLATYYWQGSRTATGAHFNPHGLTAAHRTLPFGTRLMVTNPHNHRAVFVTVNDRGPYTNAWIDLSLGSARALGMNQSSYVCVARLHGDSPVASR